MKELDKEYQTFGDRRYCELMPGLKELGVTPMNVAQIMAARIESIQGDDYKQKDFWLGQQFDTADGVAYAGENSPHSENFKIDRNSDHLIDIKQDTHLARGALPLTEEEYGELSGPEFTRVILEGEEWAILSEKHRPTQEYSRRELYDLRATRLSASLGDVECDGAEINEVENSDLWLALCGYRFDQDSNSDQNLAAAKLRDEYRYHVFLADTEKAGMSVFLRASQEIPTMRAWSLGGHIIDNRSDAHGSKYLIDYSLLVGVLTAATAENAMDDAIQDHSEREDGDIAQLGQHNEGGIPPGADSRDYTLEDLLRAREELARIREIVRPENIESLERLIGKLSLRELEFSV